MIAHKTIQSKQQFIEYCLTKLGAPVVNVDLADIQLENAVSDALRKFWDFHQDGTERRVIKYTITAKDLENGYFSIPDNILAVLSILEGSQTNPLLASISNGLTGCFNQLGNLGSCGNPYASLENALTYAKFLSTFKNVFSPQLQFEFNETTNRLIVYSGWETRQAGDILALECYVMVDPDESPEIWNNDWLKNYATSLMKKQWGTNLMKFSGATLPSGIPVNADAILSQAVQELADHENSLLNVYTRPVMPFMG